MLFRGCSREHGIFHRWADPHSRVPLVERGGVAREGAELRAINRSWIRSVPRPQVGTHPTGPLRSKEVKDDGSSKWSFCFS